MPASGDHFCSNIEQIGLRGDHLFKPRRIETPARFGITTPRAAALTRRVDQDDVAGPGDRAQHRALSVRVQQQRFGFKRTRTVGARL